MILNLINLIFTATNGCNTTSGVVNTLSTFLCAGSNIWFPIVTLGVLLVISVVGLVYMLAPLLGRNDVRVWARAKVYDGLITIVFAIIFLAFSSFLYNVPVASSYRSAGLLPSTCDPTSSMFMFPTSLGYDSIDNVYGIANCDIYYFNQDVAQYSETVFIVSLFLGGSPKVQFGPESTFGVQFFIDLLPIVVTFQYIVPLMGAYFGLIIASDILQLLIGASMLLFSTFMIIGLVARSFGITRTFGGAMIAFALGIGFVYPLLVGMSYGFLDYAIQSQPALYTLGNFACVANVGLNPATIPTVIVSLIAALFGSNSALYTVANQLGCITGPIIIGGGLIAVGLTFLPLMNFVIVDAFIIDFSRAVGERMDLMSILTRIV